jgi:hypothetical protein
MIEVDRLDMENSVDSSLPRAHLAFGRSWFLNHSLPDEATGCPARLENMGRRYAMDGYPKQSEKSYGAGTVG